ncbi:CoA transferase [Kitasatospora sp. NPDC052896]|uniref:CoA transferase n=1 Tax=Kitasatospora sp. NPDC052896 TaxID=3364061 RepID=UPI0037C5742E
MTITAPDISLDAPLAGWTVAGTSRTTAGALALRHLAELGAGSAPADTDAFGRPAVDTLTVTGPDGPIGQVRCDLGWLPEDLAAPGSETLVQAMTGLMAVHGRKWGGVGRIPVDYASTCAGVLAVHGVLATLIARSRGLTGRGAPTVGVSVTGAALLTVSQYLAAATAPEEEELPDLTGTQPPPFRSRDGVWFELETLEALPWREFWAALGLGGTLVGRGWRAFAARYATAVSPVPLALHQALAEREFAEILDAGARSGVSVCPVRSLADRRRDLGLGPDGGRVPPPWLLRSLPVGGPAPREASQLPSYERPLQGITVVEATRRIQGPLAGRILQLLGAHVIRIEPPDGDPQRGIPPIAEDCSARFLALNGGKEVVEADLKTVEGRATIRRLASRADVFLHNWAPGKAATFGLDVTDLTALNPRLVYAHAAGWPPSEGPDAYLGTDFMVQTHSGLSWQLARGGEVPHPSLMTLIDVLGGLVSAEAVLAGLLARERTGRAQQVRTSLSSAASQLQLGELEAPLDAPVPPLAPEGPFACATGSLALALPTAAAVRTLCAALGIDAEPVGLPARIADRLREHPAEAWPARLARYGVESTVVRENLADLPADPRLAKQLHQGLYAGVLPPWRFESNFLPDFGI